MGKRLRCPSCAAEAEYDVPTSEATAAQRDVRCRKCSARFNYGFRPEYVTEAEPEPREMVPEVGEDLDDPAVSLAARERLARHIARYPEYADRDRDILLLHVLGVMDHLTHEIGSVKRVVDVLSKRPAR